MENQTLKDEAVNFQVEQKESVKLVKNTKGFNWEIKLLEINLDRLEQLNNDMKRRFENAN